MHKFCVQSNIWFYSKNMRKLDYILYNNDISMWVETWICEFPLGTETVSNNETRAELNNLLNEKWYRYNFKNIDNSDFSIRISPLCTDKESLNIDLNTHLEDMQAIEWYILWKIQWIDLVNLEALMQDSPIPLEEIRGIQRQIDSFIRQLNN